MMGYVFGKKKATQVAHSSVFLPLFLSLPLSFFASFFSTFFFNNYVGCSFLALY